MTEPYQWHADIRLPPATAVWVLAAHLYALLVPLVLVLAAVRHWQSLAVVADYPALLLVAAALMTAGSAFEIAQNSIDHWYITPDTASANGTGFCDLLFYFFIVASQGAVAISFGGREPWVVVTALAALVAFPVLYMRRVAVFAPLAVVSLLAVFLAWDALGDPVVVLQLALTPLTLFFFACLLKTGAQVLHGFTTAAASSGVLFLAMGIHGSATRGSLGWDVVAGIVLAIVVSALLLRPFLTRLPATPRCFRR